MNSDKVDASGEAYAFLSTPDATLGLASFGITAALAGMGPADRARQTPWVPIVLAAKVLADASYGALLTAAPAQDVRARAGRRAPRQAPSSPPRGAPARRHGLTLQRDHPLYVAPSPGRGRGVVRPMRASNQAGVGGSPFDLRLM